MNPVVPQPNFSGQSKDKLLNLIAQGDAEVILSEGTFGNELNELMKYELITVVDDKIILTDKGKEAQKIGVQAVIKQISFQNIVAELPEVTFSRKKKLLVLTSLLLLLFALIFYSVISF